MISIASALLFFLCLSFSSGLDRFETKQILQNFIKNIFRIIKFFIFDIFVFLAKRNSYSQPKKTIGAIPKSQKILKNIFGLFHKGGITILKSIDIHSGKPNQYFELGFKYVEKVKVIDGYVYYIYRPFESIQKKFLYREKIKIN